MQNSPLQLSIEWKAVSVYIEKSPVLRKLQLQDFFCPGFRFAMQERMKSFTN